MMSYPLTIFDNSSLFKNDLREAFRFTLAIETYHPF